MADYISTESKHELVNLDAVEAVFIKAPASVDPSRLGTTKEEISRNVEKLSRSFQVVARGASTYVLFRGTEKECQKYLEDI